MRNISAAALNTIATKTGTRPIIFVDIQWQPNGQYIRYCDTEVAGALPYLKSIANIDTGVNLSGSSFGISCAVTLLDPYNEIKGILDTTDVHKRPCRIMQWFEGLELSDAFEIFRGQISSPVEWSEKDRVVSFTILDQLYSRDVGFSLEQGQFNYISDDIVGQSWPVCFGEVLNVPAVKAVSIPTAIATTMFGIPDQTLPLKKFQIETDLQNYVSAYNYYVQMVLNLQSMITPNYVTKQRVSIQFKGGSGGASYTLKYKGVTLQEMSTFDDISGIQDRLDKSTPEWKASGTPTNVILSFDYDHNKYKKIDDALSALKPSIFTASTEFTMYDKVSVYPLKVWADGSEIDYSSYETMIYTRATQVQQEYADAIISEDAIKQEIEDLNADVDKVNKLYDAALRAYENDGNAQITETLNAVVKLRNSFVSELNKKTNALTKASHDKERLEIDAHNLKYVFESIKSIQVKTTQLIENYVKLTKRYQTLLRIIDQQNEVLIGDGKVNDGGKFEQETDVDVLIKGVKVRGQFKDNRFYGNTTLPNYENIEIDARESDDLDYFWIKDPDEAIDLTNKYCQIQNGRIVYVTEQVGKRCKFNLIQSKSNIRSSPDDFTFMGMDEGMIKEAFSQSTNGTESLEELIYLAQSVPKDISAKLRQRLRGGGNNVTQVLRPFVPGKPEGAQCLGGEYYLKYDGRITTVLTKDSTAGDIRDNLYQVLGQYSATVIAYKFSRDAAEADWATAYAAKVEDPNATFADPDYIVEFHIVISDSKSDLKPVYPIEVIYSTTAVADSGLVNTLPSVAALDTNALIYDAFPGGSPRIYGSLYLDTYFMSEGAHEFTIRKIISKIESAIESSAYGSEVKSIKDRISAGYRALTDISQNNGSALDVKTIRDEIAQQEARYVQTIALVKVPETVLSEAYKMISDSEFRVLFALELLHFLAWRHSLDPISLQIPDVHSEYVIVGSDITGIQAASPVIISTWLRPYKQGTKQDIMANLLTLPDSEAFIVEPGTEIQAYGDFQEIYACNIMPSSIKAIRAFKNVDGVRRLLDLPTRYYRTDENDAYGRFTLTSITLKQPLSTFKDENWEDGIYVSMVSSVGPNPMYVIAWVLEKFSNLLLDQASFDYLATKLANYPCHFALLSPVDALTLVKDIAYQARCAAWVKQDKLYVQYLSEPGTSRYTFTESNVDFGTLRMGYSDSDYVTTKYIATWQYDYSTDLKYKVILRYNVSRFNEAKEEVDYYTLTHQELVEKSATFWLIRNSNMWKIAKFSAPLNSMNLEPFDTVTLNFAGNYFSAGQVDGVVQSANYNASAHSMDFEIWLPVRAGEMTQYIFAWPANLAATYEYPLPGDILAGNAGDPFSDAVPTGLNYDPFAINPTNIRPKDYGDITPTDLTDSIPLSPLANVVTTTQLPVKPENFDPAIQDQPDAPLQPVAVGGQDGVLAQWEQDLNNPANQNQGGQQGGDTKIVIVKEKNTKKTEVIRGQTLVDPSGSTIDPLIANLQTEIPWYTCSDDRGVLIQVEMTGLHPEDTIPTGTRIIAVYFLAMGKWIGHISTYINTSQSGTST